MTDRRRGTPAPPAYPARGRDWAVTPAPPRPSVTTPTASVRRGWWRVWWAPVVQLLTLAAVVISSAALIDVRRSEAAADLAADRGAGVKVAVTRAAVKHAAPVLVSIPSIKVRSALVDLRKNPDGTVQVPKDFGRVGWYVGSAHPGDAGPTVLIGHVDSYKGPAVFYKVSRLHKGDRIAVQRSDRSTAWYAVQSVQRFPKRSFPTALVYRGDGKPSLRLVTCGGQFSRRTGHYLDNTVVTAVPVAAPRKPPAVVKKPAAVAKKPAAAHKPAAKKRALVKKPVPPATKPAARPSSRDTDNGPAHHRQPH